MIEVEKKFILTPKQKARLLKGAEFLGEKIFTDAYFDTQDFALSKNDMWLRSRSGAWELKIPMHLHGGKLDQQYQEVEGEENIRQVFGIVPHGDFLQDIAQFGYVPFCTFTTKRRKYQKQHFTIDFDEVDYGDFVYAVAEIELMVVDKDDMTAAIEKINAFATMHGLESLPVRGKVYEYLKRKRPKHYCALAMAKIDQKKK